MSLGTNIQYLRKLNTLTQEQFAEKMSITRQTVSRWESDEVTPELNKLVEMCSIFHANWMNWLERICLPKPKSILK